MSNLLNTFGNTFQERVSRAIQDLASGKGVLLVDDENRENEGDIIFAAENLTVSGMAMMIRECSGIVCLCITEERAKQLELPPMVANNNSQFQTAFTTTIEAAVGVTTGVSATDRLTTIRAAIAHNAKPADLARPGHVFPLVARTEGVFARRGHTEGSVDLAVLAGFQPFAVLCELTNEDGSMAKLPTIVEFAQKHDMCVLSIEDIYQYRVKSER
ncbi:3,4-dihydroxy-2-butanone-4-phosphate synthase [Williamwhitmania taraxaci]|uniref:3,4-dihydroxy-2-butanone 4-phosphate synthase n=1 Tax=Williamwhitmania taraxaci TaxID=1640674 RepID=A0A1G6H6E8_9BACT|nr:3,4-dihydroxy-2-butanone-4-phosphate synthase [Williamwhitmania taraxaci]SDB89802.1 3,4-dihydroxy 2-butanone 4-phosphate synthase [Williamwhitmania taraxaci]